MLHSLDTLIGFAVIMTILSLLITVGTQMISSALSLRGKNLANALAVTLRTIDPEIGQHAEAIVEHVLARPGISDSIFSPTRPTVTAPNTTTQAAIATANHLLTVEDAHNDAQAALSDARVAFDAAENVLADARAALQSATAGAVAPAQAAYQQCLANSQQASFNLKAAQAAARPLVMQYAVARASLPAPAPAGDGRFWEALNFSGLHLSTAIRADEVYRILHELAALSPTEAAARGLSPIAPWKLGNLLKTVANSNLSSKEAADKVAATLKLVGLGNTVQTGEALIEHTELLGKEIKLAVAQGFDRFQRWFDSSGDRAQQWFSTHTRVITCILAVVLAIGLELDATEIYSRISSDAVLRTQLVSKAPGVVNEGEKILAPRETPEDRALAQWTASHNGIKVAKPDKKTRAAYVAAVRAAMPDKADEAQKSYEDILDELSKDDLNAGAGSFKSLTSDLPTSGYELIPTTYPRWTDNIVGHLLGMLFMAALLSIGAPFWFNILKSLTNLRPTLSQLIDEQPTQTAKPAPKT